MLISMTPNDEVKTIHASLNDGSLRKWEFEPYTENGKIELTDQDYATIRSIKGNTVKFNQLIQNGNFADTSIWAAQSGITFTANNNIGQLTSSTDGRYIQQNLGTIMQQGHKYLFKCQINADVIGNDREIVFYHGAFSQGQSFSYALSVANQWADVSAIFECTGETNVLRFWVRTAQTTLLVKNVLLFDLTAMEIDNLTTVEQVETWLSNNIGLLPYYAYTLGTLIPFRGTGLKTVGKNLFNPTDVVKGRIDNGNIGYDSNTTDLSINGNEISYTVNANYRGISSDFIKVKPNTLYYLKLNLQITNSSGCSVYYDAYDGGKNWIDRINGSVLNVGDNAIQFTTLANCEYIRLSFQSYLPSTAKLNNVMFADTDSIFEPYIASTLSLPISTYFPTGMKEAASVYDEITENNAITRLRYTVVDGTNIQAQYFGVYSNHHLFYVDLGGNAFKTVNVLTIVSNKYTVSNTGNMDDKRIRYQGLGASAVDVQEVNINRIYWTDDSYTSASAMNTALQSNPLEIISLAESETSQDISLDLTYPIWNNGTEQILPVNSSTPTTSSMKAAIEYPDRTEDVNFLYKQTTFESAIPQFSLVCKNQELPMTLEDGKLICECDSSITNESGFFDAKVKMQDLNSVAYSQKIQLHVERGIND